MRDGTRLATDVYLPSFGKSQRTSVLLERTPYDKLGTNHADFSVQDQTPLSKAEIATQFAKRGYVFVLQDCRGRYRSEGVFQKYLCEAEDGADTVAWIVQQPWCNGRVGTLGLSYGAHVQAALATLNPVGLQAMFLDSGGFSSAYHSGIRQGGAYELKQLTWAMKHALLSPETEADPARRSALASADIRDWLSVERWRKGHSPISAAPEYEDFILEQWQNETFTDFWKQSGIYACGAYDTFADVPMVHMSSWYDPYALTAIENFTELSKCKTGPIKLIMGPWTHGKRSLTFAGDVDFGQSSTFDAKFGNYVELRTRWFDFHLNRNGNDPLPRAIYYFQMGGGSGRRLPSGRLDHGGTWHSADTWPLAQTAIRSFYLQPDASLAETAAVRSKQFTFLSDPHDPVPTIGGAMASGAPVMEAGGFDQREGPDVFRSQQPYRKLSDRPDVLIFETALLEEDVNVTGQIVAELFVSSTAIDTDFTIKVVDVYPPSADYPEGYALNIAHGILRMRFRNSFERPEPMESGHVYRVSISSFPMSNLFCIGHRIRLEVASSNFPHFDINPNTDWRVEGLLPCTAENSVYASKQYPSTIYIPVIPATN
ncbi:CocE/NonD family hydrolase [Sphingorhabdus sp.]|uniref:CocE/NonD family hydrolase n=1 Tax=Sphingorhabdus sp. TaxID=1902408 RepID=UPI003918D0ED